MVSVDCDNGDLTGQFELYGHRESLALAQIARRKGWKMYLLDETLHRFIEYLMPGGLFYPVGKHRAFAVEDER